MTSRADVEVEHLVIGAGVSGLAFAQFHGAADALVVEAEDEIGGYCRTVHRDGFTWDFSGHFFHFKNAALEAWLRERMPGDEVRTVVRRSRVWVGDRLIDFPFQKNIHQLPRADFLACLHDLHFRDEEGPAEEARNFEELLVRRFGRSIAEQFLIPYNEKLYACRLTGLDRDAMGRFFPWADEDEIIRNFRRPDNASYNATFTYPRGGAIRYVEALAHGLPEGTIRTGERVTRIDLDARIAHTSRRTIRYRHCISSAPLDRLLALCGQPAPDGVLTSNKVLVFNLGFDRKGWEGVHWVYFPQRDLPFYRVGFYDNIHDDERMSLYVELGYANAAQPDVPGTLARVLDGLRRVGIIDGHRLVAHHSVTLDPAYVHLSERSRAFAAQARSNLAQDGLHSIGRYGAWTYCSIEDNMLEARALAEQLRRATPHG
ncbi:MAG: LPS biosynthesis protein [Deltaproteobacteria bacterium]|nr:MAG: LPS biosynthesis protein [Deltaproteobacteria bacterium]